jgi:hypothetical protein
MKDPAVLFYISDWLTGTAGMDADCRAWYLDLLLHNYDKGSLPNDIEKLAVLAGVKYSEFKRFEQVFEHVLKHKFIQNDNGCLIHPKADKILKGREVFKEKRSEAGKLSYVLRYYRENQKNKMTPEFEKYLKENIDLNELDIKNEQVLKQVFKQILELYENENINDIKNINIEFDIFWNLYDKKVGAKDKCLKKWNSLQDEEREKIIISLPEWKAKITDKQFQPFPETYLNQKRWNDEVIKIKNQPTSKPL